MTDTPTRTTMLPYGRQTIGGDDIAAVVETLRSDWLTTGPKVGEFERAFAAYTGAAEAVAVTNGTAALHAAMAALDIGPGDEVIVPPMTFAASANCVVYQGGTPVFADVDADTLLIDPAEVERRISPRTRAIVAVDYAGQPCDYDALQAIADEHGLALVADACHALGGSDHGRPVGTLADLSTFSLHPVKHITTGEGGVITTNDPELAARMRIFRNHGITSDHRQREQQGSWFYEMTDLGYNYRLTDVQCALGTGPVNWRSSTAGSRAGGRSRHGTTAPSRRCRASSRSAYARVHSTRITSIRSCSSSSASPPTALRSSRRCGRKGSAATCITSPYTCTRSTAGASARRRDSVPWRKRRTSG
jgi:hypothetical protein